jgi:beta-galactosidase
LTIQDFSYYAAAYNVLSVAVDARWINVPPAGSARGPRSTDYLLPGGITGSVSLHAVPSVIISDVFAKPVHVLEEDRRLEIACRINGDSTLPSTIHLETRLQNDSRLIARVSQRTYLERPDQEISLVLDHLGNITLSEAFLDACDELGLLVDAS